MVSELGFYPAQLLLGQAWLVVYIDVIKLKHMINNYLICFFNDVNNNVTINCTREELTSVLVKEELISSESEYNEVDWVVFENGIKIKGQAESWSYLHGVKN